jgi:tetratricopeptide (TPR) repeat protein
MLDFCTGKTTRLISALSSFDKSISPAHDLYPFYLSMKSFVLCEANCLEEALEAGLDSVERCPTNIYGIHAVAHVLHEQGLWADICLFLNEKKDSWINNIGMRMHVYWHLAIAYERADETAEAVQAFQNLYALKESPFAKQDLDAVGFLWRLHLKNPCHHLFPDIWRSLSSLWAGSVGTSTSYFHKLHAALAFAGAKQPLSIRKLIAESDGFGIEHPTHEAGIEVLESILLFASGSYDECALKLQASRPRWFLLGGSRAQRELLSLTLDYAVKNSERSASTQEYLVAESAK